MTAVTVTDIFCGGGGSSSGHTLTCQTVCLPASTGSAVIGRPVGGGYSTCQTVCS